MNIELANNNESEIKNNPEIVGNIDNKILQSSDILPINKYNTEENNNLENYLETESKIIKTSSQRSSLFKGSPGHNSSFKRELSMNDMIVIAENIKLSESNQLL